MSDLRHLAELQAKATPSPWEKRPGGIVFAPCPCCGQIAVCDQFGPDPEETNAEFIVACGNTDFAALAERLERAEKENREIVSVVRSLVMRPYMSRHQAIVDAENKALAILKRYEETEADHD